MTLEAQAEPASPAAPSAAIDDGIESFHERRLSNGMRVVVGVDRRAPLVGMNLRYAVGDFLDPVEQPGLARVIGELLPELSTRHLRGDGRDRLIEAAGFHPWKVSGGAGTDSTSLWLEVPAAALELSLYIEANRMGFAADGVDSRHFGEAAAAAFEAYKDRSWWNATGDLLERAAFGADHPYARQERMDAAKPLALVDVRERVRRYYNPATATLVMVGDVEPKVALDLAERWFGALPGMPIAAPTVGAPRSASPMQLEVRASDVQDAAGLSWATPAFLSDDDITLDVIARYLARRLLAKLAAADARVSVRQRSNGGQSAFVVYGPVAGAGSAERWRDLVLEEIAKLSAQDVDQKVLADARDSITSSIAINAVSLTGRAGHVSRFVSLRGSPDFFGGYLGGYRAADAARVAATAKRLLGVPPRIFLRLVPDEKAKPLARLDPLPTPTYQPPVQRGQLAVADGPIWYRPPLPSRVQSPVLPPIADETFKGGTRMIVVTRNALPTASIRLQVAWQAAPLSDSTWPVLRSLIGDSPLDPKQKPTAGELPLTLFRSVSPFGQYEAWVDSDELTVQVDAVPERVGEVLDRFGQVLALRRLSQETFDKSRQNLLELKPPNLRARSWRYANALMSPSGHRYVRGSLKQSQERLTGLQLRDVEQYWAKAVHTGALRFSVVGPVAAPPIRERLEKLVAKLPRSRPKPAPRAPVKAAAAGNGIHVYTSEQEKETDLLVVWPAPAPAKDGYAGAHLLRWVLGSVLWDDLSAEKVGYADTGCNYWSQRDRSVIFVALRVQPDQAVTALQSVLRSAEDLGKNDFPWVAFADARREATQWVTQKLSGVEGLNSLAQGALTNEHSVPAFMTLYNVAQQYERITLANDAARILDRKLATVIVNGRFTRTPGELQALGVGPVTVEAAEQVAP